MAGPFSNDRALGIFLAAPPLVPAGDSAVMRIDSDAVLLVKNVGGGGIPYPTGETAAIPAATYANILNTMPIAVFDPAAPVLLATEGTELRCDAAGRLLVSTTGGVGASRYNSAGDATDGDISGGAAGTLFQIQGFNSEAGGADRFFMLFDSLALPPDGTVPFWVSTRVPANTNFAQGFDEGLTFPTNVYWASSTTRSRLTITGGADMAISALFR